MQSFFASRISSLGSHALLAYDSTTVSTYSGRMFVQFVALCYYKYLSEQLRQIKQSLASEIAAPENESAEQLRLKKKLLSWMKNTPVYLMLQWYDAVEEVNVSTKLLSRRWTTEITARDRLFLEKLGVPGF